MSSLYLMLLEKNQEKVLLQFESSDCSLLGLCLRANERARAALASAKDHIPPRFAGSVLAQSLLRHACTRRILYGMTENLVHLEIAEENIEQAQALEPVNDFIRTEAKNIKRARTGKPALPNDVPWAESLKDMLSSTITHDANSCESS